MYISANQQNRLEQIRDQVQLPRATAGETTAREKGHVNHSSELLATENYSKIQTENEFIQIFLECSRKAGVLVGEIDQNKGSQGRNMAMTTPQNQTCGDNTAATVEPGEPSIPGSHGLSLQPGCKLVAAAPLPLPIPARIVYCPCFFTPAPYSESGALHLIC